MDSSTCVGTNINYVAFSEIFREACAALIDTTGYQLPGATLPPPLGIRTLMLMSVTIPLL